MSQTVSLRIVGENGQVVGTIRATKKELASLGGEADSVGKKAEATAKSVDTLGAAADNTGKRTKRARKDVTDLGAAAESTGQQAQRAGRQIDSAGEASERSRRRFGLLSGTLGELKGVLAGYAGLRGLQALVRSVDTYSDVVGKLKQVTNGESELAAAKAKTFDISQKYFQSLDATVTLYGRASRALETYGYSQQTVAKLTETVSAGLLVDRATTAEAASVMLQLSQALGAGALRGEEFNAANEAAPSVMRALANSLGQPIGKLREMAEAGALTNDVLVKAFTGPEGDKIIAAAEHIPLTIGRAWQVAKNEIVRYVGEIDQSMGASQGAATFIALLGRNLHLLTTLTIAAAVAYNGKLIVSLINGLTAWATSTAAQARFGLSLAAMEGMSTRAAVAQIGLAATSRGLGTALAFVGGPIGLAVIGLTALVAWLVTAGNQSEETARQIASNFRSAKQALDEFNEKASISSFRNLVGADVTKNIAEAKKQLESLMSAAEDAQGAYERSLAKAGDAGGSMAARLASATDAVANQRLRVEELDRSYKTAISSGADLIISTARLGDVTQQQRQQIEGLVSELVKNNLALDTASPKVVKLIGELFGAEAAARAAASGFRELQTAAGDTKYLDKMAENLAKQQVRLRGIQQGARAGSRLEFGYQILEDQKERGKPFSAAELAARYRAWQQVADATDAADAAQKRVAESKRAATAASREHTKALHQEAREQVTVASATNALNSLIRDQQNQYGDSKVRADNDHADALQRIQKVEDDLVRVHHLDAAALKQLAEARDQAEKAHEHAIDLAEKEMDIVGRAKQDYREEIMLSGLTNEARRAEEQVIRAVNEAKSQGRTLSQGEIEDLRKFATESEATLKARDAQRRYMDDVKNAVVGAASTGTRAWGDFAARGFKDFKSFSKNIKDAAKRLVSDLITMFADRALIQPLENWFSRLMSGGNGGFGQAAGNSSGGGFWQGLLSAFTGGGSGGQGGGFLQSLFGARGQSTSGSLAQAGSGFAGVGGFGGYSTPPIVRDIWGGVAQAGGGATSSAGGGFSGMSTNPYLAGIGGAIYGWRQGGDTGGKVLGAASYGVAGYAGATALAAGGAAIAGGAGIGAAASAGLAAVPVVGWIALAAIVIDKISGGKLFGTKFQTQSSAVQVDFGANGATGSTSVYQSRQRSLFGGKKWRTQTSGLSADAQAALNDTFDQISDAIGEAARSLGITAPDMLAGSFRQEFDKKGNLKNEFGTIAGRVYKEGQEAFTKRLVAENLINVAKSYGSSAEIETLANPYRTNVDGLSAFATLILSIQGDIKNATALWTGRGEGMLTRVVGLVEELGQGNETLAETYQRLTQGARSYGNFIADIDKQVRVSGLNEVQRAQLDIELQYRDQVKQANELARALGLSGARSEDLAKIEQLRAIRMAELQHQIENQRNTFLSDLSLSNLSPLRDDQKLGEGMKLLREAVSNNDLQRAQQLSQTVLGLGRNLYASGADYNALYQEVTGLVSQVGTNLSDGFNADQLDEIADLLTGMPDEIARAIFNELFRLQRVAPTLPPEVVTTPTVPPVTPNIGGGGNRNGGGIGNRFVVDGNGIGDLIDHLQKIEQNTAMTAKTNIEMAETGRRDELRGIGGNR